MLACTSNHAVNIFPNEYLNFFLPFFSRNLVDPRFAPVLVTAAEMILDIYQSVIGQSQVTDRQLLRLQELVEREIDYQQELLEVLGMLDTMFASSLPRKEVPCSGISRSNGLAQGEESTSRPQLQVTWGLEEKLLLDRVRVPSQL